GTLYEGPITISADAQITAWAVKEEMINSDTLYIDYPYTAWQTLLSAISTGQTVLRNAEVSTRVSDDMKSTLSSLIADAQDMYGVRTATESVILDKAREINELAEEMQRIIDQVEEAYAALSDNNTVLTFYYDYDKSTRNGMTLAFYAYEPSDRGWNDNAGMITKVVFDESFANYQPTSTANWLSGLSSLTSIEGMSYLKTDSVTNMWNMFGECVSLTSIDLSGFKTGKVENMGDLFGGCSGLTSLDVSYLNTENVVNMQGMFRGCSSLTTLDLSGFKTDKVSSTYSMFSESSNLKTIYVGSGWNTTINPSSEYMFLDCVSLVGGAGTVYSHDHNDFTYAHIDGGVDNPGYLTSIADTAAVAPVTFSRNMFELTLSCATPNVTIMYAIPDNETGEMTWQTYTTPLTLTGDCTVHAYAIRPNGIRSAETSYTFRASDVQQAETPTFAWIGDQLTLTTATEGASIYYTNSAGATGETLYEGPVTITADALITAWAVKEGMRNSDTLTIDYPYTLWSRLVTATKDATTTANIAANSSKVDPQMVQSLRSMIEEAEHMYSERTAERDRIQWMINELSMMISEINVQLSSAEFSFDGQTLTVSGETTLTAAVEAAGGRAHVSESVTAIFWETTATINADSLRAVGITNPNLLLYVNTASQAPADVPNVIVGDVASRIVLTDVEGEQNANFNCPRPFVAQRITYSRNFKQHTQVGVSRGWETLALPFNVQVIYKEDGTELVPFAANSQDHRTRPFWLKKVYGGELADADAIEAYKPYLLSLPNDPSVYPADYCLSGTVRFISENVTVAETNPETNYLGVNDIAVVPTFSRVEQSDEVYALNVSQELENQPEGSVFEAGLRDVRPFECYTIHTNAGPAPAFMTVADLLSGGLTGITPAVSGLPANDTEAWYTLDGRKLQERPAAKGLYIHQGRKVVVK
ncbi:MAG: BspA family leucine-rich repeat surface protein, partial [Prevotella sp.]|nr:BspA family leucine-rich repeat surface protein [Prevotella sp.]